MDKIANLMTIIRNAGPRQKEFVNISYSKHSLEILLVLKKAGFIADAVVEMGDKFKHIKVSLKYSKHGKHVISSINRVSKQGRRQYMSSELIMKGLVYKSGGFLVTTNKGVLFIENKVNEYAVFDKNKISVEKSLSIGGEVIGYVS